MVIFQPNIGAYFFQNLILKFWSLVITAVDLLLRNTVHTRKLIFIFSINEMNWLLQIYTRLNKSVEQSCAILKISYIVYVVYVYFISYFNFVYVYRILYILSYFNFNRICIVYFVYSPKITID